MNLDSKDFSFLLKQSNSITKNYHIKELKGGLSGDDKFLIENEDGTKVIMQLFNLIE
ncbi:hypothetical protein SAMN05444487_10112 [Marininema mesophilum]|uniref:Uncharacterized protein n=1 Tax=Marininema mesophilum TaxID=1048340 RepID=A0A1H2PZ72_9BACL|nr:hypothetical protein [Marininema mesophilum]SDV99804.1 hypothetical protein SAMN05444487_10112 [Marininema mesophilum]